MINTLIEKYPSLSVCRNEIEKATEMIYKSYRNGGKLLACGNGGSCSDCDHIVGELMKGFLSRRGLSEDEKRRFAEYGEKGADIAAKLQGGIPAISLPSQSAVLSAFANDVDPELVYAQLVWGYGTDKDVFLGITTSGNSKNVVAACMTAKAKNMTCIGLTGKSDCKLDSLCDVVIHVPETETYKVQELHLPVYHAICAELEKRIFG